VLFASVSEKSFETGNTMQFDTTPLSPSNQDGSGILVMKHAPNGFGVSSQTHPKVRLTIDGSAETRTFEE